MAILPALLLVILVILAYAPAVRGDYVWDDADAIVDNPLNRKISGLWIIWTRPSLIPLGHWWPLTFTSFWLEYQVWGDNSTGYHITNILLHIMNSLLLVVVFRRMMGMKSVAAWIGSLLFAVHPLNVESVAWIIERKNLLALCFYLLSALAYERHVGLKCSRYLWFSFLLFLCAMLSKTIAVTLPLALLIWRWYREERLDWKYIQPLGLFLLAGGIISGIHAHYFLKNQPPSALPLLHRPLIAARAIWFYFHKTLVPWPIMTIYPRWLIVPARFLQWMFPLSLLVIGAVLYVWRNKWGRAPLAFSAFFVVSLLSVINIVDQPHFTKMTFVNNHAVYVAIIAILGPVGIALGRLMETKSYGRYWGLPFLILILIVFTSLSRKMSAHYTGMESLFAAAVNSNPEAPVAHYNLARALQERGAGGEALVHYRKAVELDPGDAQAWLSLGTMLWETGKPDLAEDSWKKALDLQPRFPKPLINLSGLAVARGRWEEAVRLSDAALELRPDDVDAHINKAAALLGMKNTRSASYHLSRALNSAPDQPNAHYYMAKTMSLEGKIAEAMIHYERAISLNTDDLDLLVEYADFLKRNDLLDKAVEQMRNAVQIQPENPAILYSAALLESRLGHTSDAVLLFRQTVLKAPGHLEAHANLAWILATSPDDALRNATDALTHARRALELAGGSNPIVLDTLAAAYAEAGDFDLAVSTLEKALSSAGNKAPQGWIQSVKSRRDHYRRKSPWRDVE